MSRTAAGGPSGDTSGNEPDDGVTATLRARGMTALSEAHAGYDEMMDEPIKGKTRFKALAYRLCSAAPKNAPLRSVVA